MSTDLLYYHLIIPAADLFHFHQVSRQSPLYRGYEWSNCRPTKINQYYTVMYAYI